MERNRNDAPDITGGAKLALAAVAAGLLFAALGTPLDRPPVTGSEPPTIGGTTETRYEYPAPKDAVEESHVQAF